MTQPFNSGLASQELQHISLRVQAFNRRRLNFTLNSKSSLVRSFIYLLPYILHYNQEEQFFYVEGAASGVRNFDYHPTLMYNFVKANQEDFNNEFKISNSLSKEGSLYNNMLKNLETELGLESIDRGQIKGIYIMGSATSVTFTEDSDIDIWVIVDPETSEASRNALYQKLQKISTWLLQQSEVEASFYLLDEGAILYNRHLNRAIKEGGMKEQFFLLDEFYRSAVRLAGCWLLWWFLPQTPGLCYQYQKKLYFKHQLLGAKEEWIDLGGMEVSKLSPENFYSTVLWQLYKGISNPFKAYLKILTLETYIAEYPQVQLLSILTKEAIHSSQAMESYFAFYRKLGQIKDSTPFASKVDKSVELAELLIFAKSEASFSQLTSPAFNFGEEKHKGEEEPASTDAEVMEDVINPLEEIRSYCAKTDRASLLSSYQLSSAEKEAFAQVQASLEVDGRLSSYFDPYEQVLDKVMYYLESQGDKKRASLVVSCLILKIIKVLQPALEEIKALLARDPKNKDLDSQGLSNLANEYFIANLLQAEFPGSIPPDLRRMLKRFKDRYALSNYDLKAALSFNSWKITELVKHTSLYQQSLIATFLKLSDFITAHQNLASSEAKDLYSSGAFPLAPSSSLKQFVKEEELDYLEKLICTLFFKHRNEINIYNTYNLDLSEDYLYFAPIDYKGEKAWYVVNLDPANPLASVERKHVEIQYDLVSLLSWCYFNGMISDHTQIKVKGDAATQQQADFILSWLREKSSPQSSQIQIRESHRLRDFFFPGRLSALEAWEEDNSQEITFYPLAKRAALKARLQELYQQLGVESVTLEADLMNSVTIRREPSTLVRGSWQLASESRALYFSQQGKEEQQASAGRRRTSREENLDCKGLFTSELKVEGETLADTKLSSTSSKSATKVRSAASNLTLPIFAKVHSKNSTTIRPLVSKESLFRKPLKPLGSSTLVNKEAEASLKKAELHKTSLYASALKSSIFATTDSLAKEKTTEEGFFKRIAKAIASKGPIVVATEGLEAEVRKLKDLAALTAAKLIQVREAELAQEEKNQREKTFTSLLTEALSERIPVISSLPREEVESLASAEVKDLEGKKEDRASITREEHVELVNFNSNSNSNSSSSSSSSSSSHTPVSSSLTTAKASTIAPKARVEEESKSPSSLISAELVNAQNTTIGSPSLLLASPESVEMVKEILPFTQAESESCALQTISRVSSLAAATSDSNYKLHYLSQARKALAASLNSSEGQEDLASAEASFGKSSLLTSLLPTSVFNQGRGQGWASLYVEKAEQIESGVIFIDYRDLDAHLFFDLVRKPSLYKSNFTDYGYRFIKKLNFLYLTVSGNYRSVSFSGENLLASLLSYLFEHSSARALPQLEVTSFNEKSFSTSLEVNHLVLSFINSKLTELYNQEVSLARLYALGSVQFLELFFNHYQGQRTTLVQRRIEDKTSLIGALRKLTQKNKLDFFITRHRQDQDLFTIRVLTANNSLHIFKALTGNLCFIMDDLCHWYRLRYPQEGFTKVRVFMVEGKRNSSGDLLASNQEEDLTLTFDKVESQILSYWLELIKTYH